MKFITYHLKNYTTIIAVEDVTIKGGFASAVLSFDSENNYQNKSWTT
jgi:deoxyxylulose-5-phosphate synthase